MKRILMGIGCVSSCIFILQAHLYGQMCQIDISCEINGSGGYEMNPPLEGYTGPISESYKVLGVRYFGDADSILCHSNSFTQDTHMTGSVTMTINDSHPYIDYYVLVTTRYFSEAYNIYYNVFPAGQTELVKDSNDFTFAEIVMRNFDNDYADNWFGTFANFVTVEHYSLPDGTPYRDVTLNVAGSFDFDNYDNFSEPFICALSPTTILALWDDSCSTETGYEMQYRKWNETQNEWSAPTTLSLPENKSAYCINALDPESFYWVTCYPAGIGECDTLKSFIKTYAWADLVHSPTVHFLPYLPITSTEMENGVIAYSFIAGYAHDDPDTTFYDYVLIKKQDGDFAAVEINRSNFSDDFYITDLAIYDQDVFVADDQGGFLKIETPAPGTVVITSLPLDIADGFVKELELGHGNLYMAIKYPQLVYDGSQPPMGIFHPEDNSLQTYTHPDIVGGADHIAVGDYWVYLAENYHVYGDEYWSSIVRLSYTGAIQPPFDHRLEHESARYGIIDMAVNTVSDELVYISPIYGLWGSSGNVYNSYLNVPTSFANSELADIRFAQNGVFMMAHSQQSRIAITDDIYDAITNSSSIAWNEIEFWNDSEPELAGLAFGLSGTLQLPTAGLDFLVGPVVALTATAATILIVNGIQNTLVPLAPFYLGTTQKVIEKEKAVETLKDVDVDEFIRAVERWLHQQAAKHPGPIPTTFKGPDPVVLPLPWPKPQPRTSQTDTDTEIDECEIVDEWFKTNFYEWDDYYTHIKSQIPPFQMTGTSNCECVGAIFSKFVLAIRPDEEWPWEFLVSKPLSYENRDLYSFDAIETLFRSKPECYSDIFTGWISYGPWRRDESNGDDHNLYFFATDGALGTEPLRQKGEVMSASLKQNIFNYMFSHPLYSMDDWYTTEMSNPSIVPKKSIPHPNVPDQTGLFPANMDPFFFNALMSKYYWLGDSPGRVTSTFPYKVDNESRLPYEYYFHPDNHLIVQKETGTPEEGLYTMTMVMGCNEHIFKNSNNPFLYRGNLIFRHSQYLGGAGVICAGNIYMQDGLPLHVDSHSGHYKPEYEHFQRMLNVFDANGWQAHTIQKMPGETGLWEALFVEKMADTQSGIRIASGDWAGGVQFNAQLYDTSASEYASDMLLIFENGLEFSPDPGQMSGLSKPIKKRQARIAENSTSFTFTIPVDTLLNHRSFTIKGHTTLDTLFDFRNYWMSNLLDATADTLGYSTEYVQWVPAPEIQSTDQTILIYEDSRTTVYEPQDTLRFNFMVHIASDQPPLGTLCFRYVHKESRPDLLSAIYRFEETTREWIEMPTTLNTDGTFFETEIDQNGLYALFGVPDLQETELSFTIHALLQGAYDTNTHKMNNNLSQTSTLPFCSPYGESCIQSEGMPDTLVDWINVELYSDPTLDPVWQQSGLVTTDGQLCTADGDHVFKPFLAQGEYYLVLKHHGYLQTTSASPLMLLAADTTRYQFSDEKDKYADPHSCVLLESNRWGFVAGDLNGDGNINTADYAAWINNKRNNGGEGRIYDAADLNMDGYIDIADYDLWLQNAQNGF